MNHLDLLPPTVKFYIYKKYCWIHFLVLLAICLCTGCFFCLFFFPDTSLRTFQCVWSPGTTVDDMDTNFLFLCQLTQTRCVYNVLFVPSDCTVKAHSLSPRLGARRGARRCRQQQQQGGSSDCIHIKNCIAFLTTPDLRYISYPRCIRLRDL